MAATVDVCIFITGDEKKKKAVRDAVERQSLKPVHVFEIALDEKDPAKSYNRAIRKMRSELVLFLHEDYVPRGVNFIAALANEFSDGQTALAASRAIASGRATGVCGAAFNARYQEKAYAVREKDLVDKGVECFLFSAHHTMYRTSFLKQIRFTENCVTDPGYLAAADLFYRGYVLRYQPGAEVVCSEKFRFGASFKAAFDLGLAVRTYNSRLGVGSYLTGMRIDRTILGKKLRIPPVIRRNMRQVYTDYGRKAGETLRKSGCFYKLPAIWWLTGFSVLNDFLGGHYMRLPAWICRNHSGHPEFFKG